MSRQDGFRLRTPSPEEAGPELDLLPDHESLASKTDLYPEFCYPDSSGDVVFSTTLFTTIYEEEELRELHYWGKDFLKSASVAENPCEDSGLMAPPTIYHILRLFDSIRSFHRVSSFLKKSQRCQSETADLGLPRPIRSSPWGKLYFLVKQFRRSIYSVK